MTRHTRSNGLPRNVVIVGSSLAGYRTAQSLRSLGYRGPIHLVGTEPHLPYDRPPLSKGYLARTFPEEDIWLASLPELDSLELTLHLGVAAVALDPVARRVELDDGSRLDYDALVVATGASPRLVAGLTESSRPPTVHTLRTIEDARDISDMLTVEKTVDAPRLVVVGAGFIGSEVASTALDLGAQVTVVDSRPSPMHAVVHDEVGSWLAARQHNRGVDLRMSHTVEEIMVTPDESGGHHTDVRLRGGGSIPADLIVVGVGVTPNTAWLEGSGLHINDGLLCDEKLQATPGVWAAGDVAKWAGPDQPHRRLEHWTNAIAQAEHVAAAIMAGRDARPFRNVPYYWSDQFSMRLEVIGEPPAGSEFQKVWETPETDAFIGVYRENGRVVGAVGVNAVSKFLALRRTLRIDTNWTAVIDRLSW